MAFHVRAAFVVCCLAAAALVRAGDMCPAPPKYRPPIASDIAADDHRIHIDSDDAEFDADRNAVVSGRVKLRQDARSVSADSVNYNEKTGRVAVNTSRRSGFGGACPAPRNAMARASPGAWQP